MSSDVAYVLMLSWRKGGKLELLLVWSTARVVGPSYFGSRRLVVSSVAGRAVTSAACTADRLRRTVLVKWQHG